MKLPKIDHALAGTVITFDAQTGEVLHVHEKIVETLNGKSGGTCKIKKRECEDIRAEVAGTCPGRRVDAVIAPRKLVQSPGERYCVDAMTRKVSLQKSCDDTFPDAIIASPN